VPHDVGSNRTGIEHSHIVARKALSPRRCMIIYPWKASAVRGRDTGTQGMASVGAPKRRGCLSIKVLWIRRMRVSCAVYSSSTAREHGRRSSMYLLLSKKGSLSKAESMWRVN